MVVSLKSFERCAPEYICCELGQEGVNRYQNPPRNFVCSPSRAEGGATTCSLEQRAAQKYFGLSTCLEHCESDVAWFLTYVNSRWNCGMNV